MNIMLVGIPGSGKSTITNHLHGYVVISTDATREKLWGDASHQGPWSELWQDLQRQIFNARKLGKPVCYDACNLTEAHRKPILETFPGNWKAVVFMDDAWTCWKRNNQRERVVPGFAFNAMVEMFEYPKLSEGFASIQEVSLNKTAK